MIEVLRKLRIDRTYLKIIRFTYDKLIANILLTGEKSRASPIKIRNKTRVSTHHFDVL